MDSSLSSLMELQSDSLVHAYEIMSNIVAVYLAIGDDFFVGSIGKENGNVNYSMNLDTTVTKCLL